MSGLLLVNSASGAAGGAGGILRGITNLAKNQFIKNFAKNAGDAISKGYDAVVDGRRKAHAAAQQKYQEEMNRLRAIACDKTRDKWERDEAKALLAKAANQALDAQKDYNEFNREAGKEALRIGAVAVQGAVTEGLAQLAHDRELQKTNLQAKQARKAAVEQTKEWIKALTDPKNAALAVGVSGGIFGCWFGLKHGIGYIADKYSKPALADDNNTSLKFGPINMVMSWISGTQSEASSISDVILKPALAKRIEISVQALKNTVKNGGYLKNIMFWGQPGTGKTLLAKRMARSCGLEYIYFAASNLEAFGIEEATRQLVQLFRFAQSSSRKLMIIIDEAELLLGDRNKPEVTDKKRTLLNLILTYTGTESRDFMICVLTNRPQDIDEAFLTRCDDRIQIAAPEAPERRAILQLYVDKIIRAGGNMKHQKGGLFSRWFGKEEFFSPITIEEDALSDKALDEIALKLDGWVGRDIFKFVNEIQSSASGTLDNKITKELINQVLTTKLAERRDKDQGFIRDVVGTSAA